MFEKLGAIQDRSSSLDWPVRSVRKSICVAKAKIKLIGSAGGPIVAQAGF